jgi:hypothetical protein
MNTGCYTIGVKRHLELAFLTVATDSCFSNQCSHCLSFSNKSLNEVLELVTNTFVSSVASATAVVVVTDSASSLLESIDNLHLDGLKFRSPLETSFLTAAGALILFKLVPTGAPFEQVANLSITKIMVVIMVSSIALLRLLQIDSHRICGQWIHNMLVQRANHFRTGLPSLVLAK